jgi:hypothetical protein
MANLVSTFRGRVIQRKKAHTSKDTPVFNLFICNGHHTCTASINVVSSAVKGRVLAVKLNENHNGHIHRNLHNRSTGRSLALEKFMECCVVLRSVGVDVKQGIEIGLEFDWIDKQEEDVQVAAFLFCHYVMLLHQFWAKFTGMKGVHRVYGHLHVDAFRSMEFDTIIDFLRYVGERTTSSETREIADRGNFKKAYSLITACGDFVFDSIQLFQDIPTDQGLATEALILNQLVKNEDGVKQIINKNYESVPQKYLFTDDEENLEVGAILLVYGLMSGVFKEYNLNSMKSGS